MSTPPFLWGVATSAYQSEGGYNGKGEPQTNWALAEALGNAMKSGSAAEFWTRYPEDFAACHRMGLNAFRLSVEWSRIQPTHVNYTSDPPGFDLAALDHYADMLAACRNHGLEPILTLHHFVHPAWLGIDAWREDITIDLFERYVRRTVEHLNRRLIDTHGQAPVRFYITINEPNTLMINTYLTGLFPTRTISTSKRMIQATGRILSAHVRAYNAIHDLHAAHGWPTPQVTLNTFCADLYWIDKVFLDLLSLRENQVPDASVTDYVFDRARAFESAYQSAGIRLTRDLPYRIGERIRHSFYQHGFHSFNAQDLGILLETLRRAQRPGSMDFIAIDYYDPFIAHVFRLPSFQDLEFRDSSFRSRVMNSMTSKWWDWHVLPSGMHFFCEHYSKAYGGRPVMIAENGMALHRKKSNGFAHRRDRVIRSAFLRAHVEEVLKMVAAGIPVFGYMHWSLFDNYEWGTYTPRFGLFSIDYTQGTDRLVEDHLGDRPSETYARLIGEKR